MAEKKPTKAKTTARKAKAVPNSGDLRSSLEPAFEYACNNAPLMGKSTWAGRHEGQDYHVTVEKI